jgi:hypothetical protein
MLTLVVRRVMVIAYQALHGNGITGLDAMQVQDGVFLFALWDQVGSGSLLYSFLNCTWFC